MQAFVFCKRRLDRNTYLGLGLMFLWFAGLFLGFLAARFYGDTLVPFLDQAAGESGSWISFLLITAFPLLLSACAVYLICPVSVLAVCLFRAVSIGYLAGGILVCYQSAGVLVTFLMLFSALVFSPFLLWYWWRRLVQGLQRLKEDTVLGLVLSALIGAVDFFFISHYLADIIK